MLGCEGLSRNDDRRYALGVLNAALGGGMSSRLFQEIREKRGLAYSVYSFASQNADTGMWGIYVGCLPSKADEVLAICISEVEKLVSGGLTDAELDRGKGQMRGSIVLGLEDPSSRMSRLGKSELVYPRLEPVEETLAAIEAVSHDDVRAVAAEVLGRPKALAVVGPFDDGRHLRRRPPLTAATRDRHRAAFPHRGKAAPLTCRPRTRAASRGHIPWTAAPGIGRGRVAPGGGSVVAIGGSG